MQNIYNESNYLSIFVNVIIVRFNIDNILRKKTFIDKNLKLSIKKIKIRDLREVNCDL